ncbi:trypsin, alkaline A-like [Anticarsia gemmatalis]|uniref:trypsin, alkaline A-like n=1 Tax=Anticarsia gemmatalis TaxID=129554 RepID=UPI003F7573A1
MRVIVFLGLLGCAIATPKSTNRIVGGSPTTVEAYPYMANLEYGWLGSLFRHSCGGSLITNFAVLTAAHCVSGEPPEWFRVRLGTSFRLWGGDPYHVARYAIPPHFNVRPLDADIAVLRLTNPAIFSDSIQPARISGPNYNLPDGTPVTTLGWGSLEFGGTFSDQLQHVELNIINHTLCTERYEYLQTQPDYERFPGVTENMLCTGILDVGGKDACQGDSGGPVAHAGDIIVGVVSWGFECADPFYPSVVASVSKFTDWIVANA